jgi:RNA polymerase sigma-70 factor (ECF subfamily)
MSCVDPDSDLDLVSRLRARDPDAFTEAHRRFNTRIFGFLARLTRRRDVAEDLVEETWLRLLAHSGSLRPDTELGPWLFTVARNLYRSYCRARLLETGHADDLIGLWPFGSPQPTPFEATAASETERRLEAALASLPTTYREVLLLVGVEGLQPKEAAAICGITPESLRQRLHRARTLLAERLDASDTLNLTQLNGVNEVLP